MQMNSFFFYSHRSSLRVKKKLFVTSDTFFKKVHSHMLNEMSIQYLTNEDSYFTVQLNDNIYN